MSEHLGKGLVPSDNIRSLEARRLQRRLGHLAVLEVTDKGVRVLILVQICKRVVDAAVTGLISPDIVNQVLHSAVTFRHMPVLVIFRQSHISANAHIFLKLT